MKKKIIVNGKEMTMVSNALVPRLYRSIFGTDLMLDMQKLTTAYNNKANKNIDIPPEALTIFENVAWCFLKQGGEDVGSNPDEWLETIEIFSIYEVLPQIVELWNISNASTSKSKKK